MAFALVSEYNPIFSCCRGNSGVFQQPAKYLIIIAVLLLASCASTQKDFRETSPTLTIKSKKSAKEVALCISDGWSEILNGFTMQQRTNGYTITFVNNGLIYYMADVINSADGSITNFWAGTFTISHYVNILGNIAKKCQ